MKVILDNGRSLSPDEIEWGMTRYGVWDDKQIIDTDNDLIALAKRHELDPADVKSIQDQKNKN